tara:strand:- start:1268 stop:1549 length:282 start_codon:yes stop_codon:yes gene_type:complete
VFELIKEFWVSSYKSDKTAFWFELVSVAFTICGSCILTFTSPTPIMSIVFPIYWIGSSTMLIAGIRRRQIWLSTLTAWFTTMNTIGLYRVFIL